MYFAQPLLGNGLGEIAASAFSQRSIGGNDFVLDPLTPEAKASVQRFQRAADAFLNKLPTFNQDVRDQNGNPITGILPNPIGGPQAGSGSKDDGYDGIMGPNTRGLGLVALVGAGDLLRQANAGGFVTAAASALADPTLIVFATLSDELAPFLEDVTVRFDQLLASVSNPATQSVLTKPPPIIAPTGVSFKRGMSGGAKVAIAAGVVLAVAGITLAAARAAKHSAKRPHRV